MADEIFDTTYTKSRKDNLPVIRPVVLPVQDMKLFRPIKPDSQIPPLKMMRSSSLRVPQQVIAPAAVDTNQDLAIEHPQVVITESAHIIKYIPQIAPLATISGLVVDKKTGQLLEGANIRFNKHKIGTKTDSLGRFIVTNIPGGNQILWISMIGYETARIGPFTVKPFSSVILYIPMQPSVFRLKREVTVKGVKKGIEFFSGRCRYPRRDKSPKVTVDINPAVPFLNVISISMISTFVEFYPSLEETYIYHYIQMVSRDNSIDLSKDALHFYHTIPGGKAERVRIADPSLSIFDQFDKRMIEREAVKAPIKERHTNAHRQKTKNSRR
jgi:hypothetical protein